MKVDGMTCEHCELSVVKSLQDVGVSDVRVDHRRGEAIFNAPADVDPAILARAVSRAGYQPGPVETVETSGAGRFPASPDGDYDLAIVGSGGAAFAAAIRARELGARVVMIERDTLGGTCVNVGCVPSKTLLHAGDLYHQAGHHPFRGIHTVQEGVVLGPLVDQKNELVHTLRREKYEELIAEYGWDLVRGEARFLDGERLEVDGEVVTASRILIATGASPAVPSIPGLAEAGYLTSTTALALSEVPESLVVIGSGFIALELGQLFRHLGSHVTVMQRSPRILKGYEPEVAEAVYEALSEQGMSFVTGARFTRVEKRSPGYHVAVEVGGETRAVEAEQLLVAIGRRPNTAALHLDRAGVKVGPLGEIVVDAHLRTTNPCIFAAGDVTAGPQFVYVAAYQGTLAAENALSGAQRRVDLSAVPAVVFTSPSIATVGLTEEQAKAAGHAVKNSVLPVKAVPRALVNHDTHGVFKIVADSSTDRILGVHVVSENAGDVIYAATLAVKFDLTVHDLVSTFAPYLTMAEGLKLAAQTFGKDVAKLSCCAS
ncbi:MAG: mercury(II) reductase [Chloroflexota bacterium]|nr:MAG: mercury(II) reductase [Chloroflexota bacterium]